MSNILHNATVDTLLERRSIRKFKPKPLPDDVRRNVGDRGAACGEPPVPERLVRHIRVTEPAAKKRLAEIGGQPYIATAPLLYVFVLDEHRNAAIAARKGVEVASDAFTLNGSYRFTQAQNDAVLALHAMETAAYSLGLGCVILGSLLNDVPRADRPAESARIHVPGAGHCDRQARSGAGRQAAYAAFHAVLRERVSK